MEKRFYQLKLGEQFDSGDGWDFLKCSFFKARCAHAFPNIKFFYFPWTKIRTIAPSPYCKRDCLCKEFSKV